MWAQLEMENYAMAEFLLDIENSSDLTRYFC